MQDRLTILAVETALGACSVAVLERFREKCAAVLAHRFVEMARGHAEALAPMVEAAMADSGLAFSDLDRLAVTTGPGTFTGQRVGLAFMRGLRVALGKPLTGVTTLEAMAAATGADKAAAIHDAKRGEAYLSLWDRGAVTPPAVMAFADAVAAIRTFGPCALAGTGAPQAHSQLEPQPDKQPGGGFVLSPVRQPDALVVARLALGRPAPDVPPAPLYLRAPDAKLPADSLAVPVLPRARTSALAGEMAVAAPSLRRPEGANNPILFDSGKDDVEQLAALHASSFSKPWDAEALSALLAGPGVFAHVVPDGFVLTRVAGGEAEILTLAVAPAARRRGLGRALMLAAAARAASLGAAAMFLEAGTGNDAALALYARMGFARIGLRKGYYADAPDAGRDAWVLRAELPLPCGRDFA